MMAEWHPGADDVLLLRAAVGDAATARAAWDEWSARHRFEDVDGEMYWLLPAIHRNLRRQGRQEGLDPRIAGLYKRAWFKNRLAFHHAARAIAALEAAGVPTLVLKGAALALGHYRDAGARVMEDVDVLVPPGKLGRAIAVLAGIGFRAGARGAPLEATADDFSLRYSYPFHDAAGNEIDLHWFLSSHARVAGVDDALWAAAVPLVLEGAATRALAPTDQLFHVVAHGYTSNTPHVRWLVDAATVLAGGSVDWTRFVEQARARRIVPAMRAALEILGALLGTPVPAAALTALVSSRVSLIDRLEHANDVSAKPYTVGKVMLRLWCTHRRGSSDRAAALATFPGFLRRYYGAAGLADLAAMALRRGARRFREFGIY